MGLEGREGEGKEDWSDKKKGMDGKVKSKRLKKSEKKEGRKI